MIMYNITVRQVEGEKFIIKEFTNGRLNSYTDKFTGACRQIKGSSTTNTNDIFNISLDDKYIDQDAVELLCAVGAIQYRGLANNGKVLYSFMLDFFRKYLNRDVIKYEEDMSIYEFLMDNSVNERTLL